MPQPLPKLDRRANPRLVIEERIVAEVMREPPPIDHVGWFAARQPALLAFLEERLAGNGDAHAVGIDAAWRICRAIEAQFGVPVTRLTQMQLSAAEDHLFRDHRATVALHQPALCRWIARHLADAPLPLSWRDARDVSAALNAVVAAIFPASDRRDAVEPAIPARSAP